MKDSPFDHPQSQIVYQALQQLPHYDNRQDDPEDDQ
jgi:hypothetical protein